MLTYILTTSIMFMPVGRLSDMVGRKKVYLAGFVVYGVGAAVGGAALVFPQVIAAKIIQGIGAAGIQANALAIISSSFPEHERGKAIGLYTTIIGTGLISGPIIGGLLISWLGWWCKARWPCPAHALETRMRLWPGRWPESRQPLSPG